MKYNKFTAVKAKKTRTIPHNTPGGNPISPIIVGTGTCLSEIMSVDITNILCPYMRVNGNPDTVFTNSKRSADPLIF